MAHNVQQRFTDGKLETAVLHNIDLCIHAGETVAIIGTSGSGKSTLLHLLGGLDTPTHGTVQWSGVDVAKTPASALGKLRNQHLGFIYQFHHLLAELTALENVAMPLRIRRVPEFVAQQQAKLLLEAVGLSHRLHHHPSELSGGERQRVAIARALVTQPRCILADEPTGNLDKQTANQVFELMLHATQNHNAALVLVTHDETLAQRCQRRYRLTNGVCVLV